MLVWVVVEDNMFIIELVVLQMLFVVKVVEVECSSINICVLSGLICICCY